jgi:P pilus assembly chaperone PapD
MDNLKIILKYFISLVCLAVIINSGPVQAVQVSMSANTMNISAGKKAYLDIWVSNKSEKPVAVENALFETKIDKSGQEVQVAINGDEILIYPEQAVLAPGERITVTVRWLGDSEFDAERAYFFKAKEIPYITHEYEKLKKETSDKQVRFNTVITVTAAKRVFVKSPDQKSNLKVNYIRYTDSKKGQAGDYIEINATNKGTAHTKPSVAYIKYKVKGKRKWSMYKGTAINTWLVNQTESVIVDWPKDVEVEGTKLKFLKFK